MSQRDSQRDFWSQNSVRDVVASQVRASQQTDQSPMPAAVLPDLVAQAPVGEPAECDVASKKGKPRRSVAEMQLEMHNKGAFFLQFSEPGSAPNGDRIARTPAYAKGVSDFRAMEEKGFFITLDGCMFPHEQYCTPKGVSTLKGHQRSCYFFTGVAPEASTLSGKGKKRYAHLHHGC